MVNEHVKLFCVRGCQVAVLLDRDDHGHLALVFRLWSSLSEGPIEQRLTLNMELPEDAAQEWDRATLSAFENMNAERVEQVVHQLVWPLVGESAEGQVA